MAELSAAIKRDIELVSNKLTASAREFEAAVDRFTEDILPRAYFVVARRIALDTLQGVVSLTPVDTGRAQGNWQLTVGELSDEVFDTGRSQGAIMNEAVGELAKMGLDDTIWISNNLEYVIFLEKGHSKRAPRGMVAVTLTQIAAQFAGGIE